MKLKEEYGKLRPPSIHVQKRETATRDRPLIEVEDIVLCFQLPLLLLISWICPEHYWRKIVRWLSPFIGQKQACGNGLAFSGFKNEGELSSPSVSIALEGNRIESYLQYLRDYRPSGWQVHFTIENDEELRQAREAGLGAILWIAHFVYNGLPLKKAMFQAGYRVSHLSRPEHGFSTTRFAVMVLNPIRSHVETRYLRKRIVIKRGAEHLALREARRLVKKGEIVSITAGHWEGKRIASMPIGKAFLPLAIGAPSLAHATGAPLFPVFIRQMGDQTFRITIGNQIEFDKAAQRDQVVQDAIHQFSGQLVPMVLSAPGQWRGWKYLRVE